MSNKPKIRFKGFDEAWEQRKVGELCSISTGKSNTQDNVEDGEYPFYVRSATIERSNKYLYDEEAVLTVGDGVGTGKVFHYVNGKYDLHQRVYRMYDFSGELYSKYFYHYFSKNFYRRVMAMTAKTSVDSVRMEMIADMDIIMPKREEQEKIGKCFDDLDALITLHQRKCEQTKTLKKYMLKKMFPQEGANTPEIRFSGFTDAWEQRKLGDVAEQMTSTVNPQDYLNDYFMEYSMPAFDEGEMAVNVLGSTMNSVRKVMDKPCLLINKLNVRKKRIWNVENPEVNAVCSAEFVPISSKEAALDFIKYVLIGDKFTQYLEECSSGSSNSQKRVTPDDIMSAKIFFPVYDEQHKIGKYFSNLDHLITLHQRKSDDLKELKRFMLQNMFPSNED
jgi:type I restriction enzyme S subunit